MGGRVNEEKFWKYKKEEKENVVFLVERRMGTGFFCGCDFGNKNDYK